MFLSLLTAVLKALGRPRTSWILYAAPILILYTVATGMSASAVRACIMAIVFLGAPLFRRRVDAATALAAAALLILAAAPPQLFDPGFLLSFLVVGGLMAFYRAILRFMERWLPGDPWQLDVPRMTKISRASVRALASLVSASLAAWLVSAPLTAVFFHLSSPVALVANLLVVPLAYFILLGGCLSLAVGTVSAFGAEVFNHATRVFVDMMLWSVDLFAGVPGGYQFVRAPPLVGVFLFYALLLMLFFGTRTIRRNAALAAVVVSAGWGVWHYGNDRAVVLWNGQGRTPVVFLDLPRDRDVLIDTGDSFQSASLVRFLHARGVDRLETLVLARPSAEAMGGAEKLMAEIPVGEVLVPGWPGRSKTFDRFMASCRQKSIPVRPLAVGATGHWAGRVRWEILHPSGRSYTSAERGGLVLHLSRGPGAMLFAGGGGEEAERELLGRSRDLGADVLLTGLRQGSAPWSADLLDAVHPLLRVESAPTFGSLDAPGIVSVPREQVWRAVLPGGQFHSLERMGRAVSSPWNLRADHWWQGSLEPIDR